MLPYAGVTELQFVVQKRGGGGGGGGTDGNTSCATPSREVAITDLVFFPMTAISYWGKFQYFNIISV